MIKQKTFQQIEYVQNQLNQLRKGYLMRGDNEIPNSQETDGDELTPDKMSIAALLDYCHTALNQIIGETNHILAQVGNEPELTKTTDQQNGVFHSSKTLVEKLANLKTQKIDELLKYFFPSNEKNTDTTDATDETDANDVNEIAIVDNLEKVEQKKQYYKMSIPEIIKECHDYIDTIMDSINLIFVVLVGQSPIENQKKDSTSLFNNCIDLADKLIKLRDQVTELGRYISNT